jgi:hypothetical protein
VHQFINLNLELGNVRFGLRGRVYALRLNPKFLFLIEIVEVIRIFLFGYRRGKGLLVLLIDHARYINGIVVRTKGLLIHLVDKVQHGGFLSRSTTLYFLTLELFHILSGTADGNSEPYKSTWPLVFVSDEIIADLCSNYTR